jgi:acetyl esterase/lipase
MIHFMTGEPVDDSILLNGHTTSAQKESFALYINHSFLPGKLRTACSNEQEETIMLKNDTSNKYSRLRNILLDKNVSPLLADDEYLRKNTPPHTLLFTVEMDIVRDDGFIYAERLRRLGLNVKHKHYESSFHGVWGLNYGLVDFDDSHIIMNDLTNAIKLII